MGYFNDDEGISKLSLKKHNAAVNYKNKRILNAFIGELGGIEILKRMYSRGSCNNLGVT